MKTIKFRLVSDDDRTFDNNLCLEFYEFDKAVDNFEHYCKKKTYGRLVVTLQAFSNHHNDWVTLDQKIIRKTDTPYYVLQDTKTGLYLSKYACILQNCKTGSYSLKALRIHPCKRQYPPLYTSNVHDARRFDDIESAANFNVLVKRSIGHYLHRVELR